MPLVNDGSRVFLRWVNGDERLFYHSSQKDLNKALAAFAKVAVKNHIVVLRPGPSMRKMRDGKMVDITWELHIIGGIARERAKDDLEDLELQKDPVMTIYVGGEIDLDKLEIPPGVIVRSFLPEQPKESQRKTAG
jgi:hypothetical protein